MFLLSRYGGATMDRKSFGHLDTEGKHFLRLSTATDLDSIKQGIALLQKASSDRDGFASFMAEGKHLT